MKCTNCGQQISDSAVFCTYCGTKQEPPVVAPAAPAEPAAPVAQTVVPVMPEPTYYSQSVEPSPNGPRIQFDTNRGMLKMILLGLITLGIYPTVIWCKIITELNVAACRHDGKRTMPYFAMTMLTPITFGIFYFVWIHKLCNRMGDELKRRGIDYKISGASFWLWNVLGSFIIVGPFVFLHKLMKAMNLINADFNVNG